MSQRKTDSLQHIERLMQNQCFESGFNIRLKSDHGWGLASRMQERGRRIIGMKRKGLPNSLTELASACPFECFFEVCADISTQVFLVAIVRAVQVGTYAKSTVE